MFLLSKLLRRLVCLGTVSVIDAEGRRHEFRGALPGPTLTLRLHNKHLAIRLFLNPSLRLGEAYVDGSLTIEDGTIYDFLDLMGRNLKASNSTMAFAAFGKLERIFRPFQQYNPIKRSRRNVAHHYDLSETLYDYFLDKDRQYSCAYFAQLEDSLEIAQERKKRHIAAKLQARSGQSILDIGSGWGGLALHLARETGANVTGVTLSEEQLKISRQRAMETGNDDHVSFQLRDYREQTGVFDRIVSVGMFEHVGANHFDTFFGKLSSLLADDGVALIHTIGRSDVPGVTDPWIRKYIFPGGYIPALSEILPAIERSGLFVTDIEVLRLHYAETLRHWRMRFLANRHKVSKLYDDRFCRMWEFYLAASEISFRYLKSVVFQLQLTKRQDAVPLTRDYITDWDRQPMTEDDKETRRSA